MANGGTFSLNAFGLRIALDFALPGTAGPVPTGEADLHLERTSRDELEVLLDEPRYMRYLHSFEGCGYAMLEGERGDVLFHYRQRALFHLSADYTVLRCAVSEHGTAWQRVLMDTILWTVSLLRGFELLHASAVVTSRGVIAFVGPSGAGKTTLASELIRRGGVLFCDDIVALAECGGQMVAHPGPPLMNVPNTLPPDTLGVAEVLADLGSEQWVAVAQTEPLPQPIRAIVLLDRTTDQSDCTVLAATSLTLLPHLVTLTHLTDRRRQQFETAGSLAAEADVVDLSGPLSADPAHLVDLLCQCLEGVTQAGSRGG